MINHDEFDPLKLSEFLSAYVRLIGRKSGDYHDVRNLNGQLVADGQIENHYTITPQAIKGTIEGRIKDLQVSGWFEITQVLKEHDSKVKDYREAMVAVILTQNGKPQNSKPNELTQVTKQMLRVSFINGEIISGRSVQSGSYKSGDAYAEWVLERTPNFIAWRQTRRFQRVEIVSNVPSETAQNPVNQTEMSSHDPFAGYTLTSSSIH